MASVLAAGALALSGCAPSGESTEAGPTKLTFSPNTAPSTLDILTVDDRATTALLNPDVYEGLTRETYDADGTLTWVPSLATEWNEVAPDQWRFTIRPDVTFHDGTPLTADDVVFSINRRLEPTSASTVTLAKIDHAEKVDDMTVDVFSKVPDLYVFRAMYAIPITPNGWGVDNAADAATSANGTGPYELTNYSPDGSTATLTKYADYWGDPAKIDEIDMKVIPDASSALSALQTGETDVVLNLTPDLAAQAPATLELDSVQQFLGRIGAENPVYSDVRVREALNLAIDKQSLIDNIFLGHASAPDGQIAAPTALGFNDKEKDFAFDPDKAKQLIKEAGATGAPLTLMCSKERYGTAGSDLCEAIAQMWTDVGFTVDLQFPPSDQWLSNGLYAKQTGVTPPDVFIVGAGTNDLDASTTLISWLDCSVAKNSYCNPDLQKTISDASQLTDEDAREAALEKAASDVNDVIPFVWLPRPQNIWGVSTSVDGTMYPIAEDVRWADWSIK